MAYDFKLFAQGKIAAAGTYDSKRGFSADAIGHGAVGRYDMTGDQAFDATQCTVLVTPIGTTDVSSAATITADGVLRVQLSDGAGAGVDNDFYVTIVQIPGLNA
jgi:hypothetical protein